jgi:hypothetical protein
MVDHYYYFYYYDSLSRKLSTTFLQCTNKKGSGQTKPTSLSTYVKASANNDPTDNYYELGPPYDTYTYPFNQIQGFWQVDTSSVQVGLLHSLTLLQDNQQSQVNVEMVKMAYHGEFNSIGLFSMDNVALNGNAMFSVLRSACGQSVLNALTEFVGYITHDLECSAVCYGDSFGGYGVNNADSGVSIEEERSTRGEMYGSGGPLVACSGSILLYLRVERTRLVV